MNTRLLQISNYLYPNIGGIEQVARDIAGAVSELPEFEQKILCFNETARDGEYVCSRKETVHDRVDGVEVIRCGCVTKQASQSVSLTFGAELKKLMEDFRPDIVIFHYPNPFQCLFLEKYLKNQARYPFRFILYWHLDITKQKRLEKLFRAQTIRLLERADQIVATSPVYIDGSPFLSRYREKCTVIPNCINTARLAVTDSIREKAARIRKKYEGKILCFGIGRHIPYKGFTYLVQASRYLDDRFRILIGGKGPLTEELKAQARGDEKVIFLGRLDDENLIAHFVAMDIFCFPSITKNEAFGIALAEGLYFGKPAVTFTIPGSGVNYVNRKDETGLEVPNGDSKAYAEALIRLAEDPELRDKLGAAARKRVEELFLTEAFRRRIQVFLSQGERT